MLGPASLAQDPPTAAAPAASPPKAYVQLKVDVDAKVCREWKQRVSRMLTGGFKSGDETIFDDYYKKCVFPTWTNPDSYSVKGRNVRTPRQSILRDLKTAKHGSVYDRLNRLVMDQMIEFAQGNYCPATRYNAMLVIGELNVEEPAINRPPKPLPEAFARLLAAAEDDKLPDAVRVAALQGIVRHGKYGASDAESRQKISSLMLSLATTRNPPPRRSKEGHTWFRCLAIDTLGQLGSPGQQGTVAKALVKVLGESTAPLSVRCEAARALGRLKMTPQTGLDPTAVAQSLGYLATAACEHEIHRCEEDTDRVIDVRKLKAQLVSIRAALTGNEAKRGEPFGGILALATEPNDKTYALTVRNRIEDWLGMEKLDREDLVPKVEKPGKKPEEEDRFGMPLGPMFGGPEAGGLGGGAGFPSQPDPVKIASDEVLAALKTSVLEFKKFLAGTK